MSINQVCASWISLIVAILFGVSGTIALKLSQGLTKTKPVIILIFSYLISFVALTFAVKYIQLSVVYAVWSGIGTLLVTAIGVVYFKEVMSLRKVICVALIIIGVVGIHLTDGV